MDETNKTVDISPEGKLEEKLEAQSVVPAAAPMMPAEAQQRVIRTFSADLATVMKDKKGSVLKIAVAEEARRSGERAAAGENRPAPKKNFIFLSLSVLALLGGLGFLTYVYFSAATPENPSETAKIPSLIFAETSETLALDDLSQAKLSALAAQKISTATLRLDTIKELYFTKGAAGEKADTGQFFAVLNTRIPPVLLRSLRDDFMFGLHAYNGTVPFLLFKTDFYENAFLGLLKWEHSMAADLLPLFGVKISAENRYLLEKGFEDVTVKNRDARVLFDGEGAPVLMYSMPRKDTIIITASPDTLEEVTRRLSSSPK